LEESGHLQALENEAVGFCLPKILSLRGQRQLSRLRQSAVRSRKSPYFWGRK
jgi:hypothetical protein